jgi:hypothetical protein
MIAATYLVQDKTIKGEAYLQLHRKKGIKMTDDKSNRTSGLIVMGASNAFPDFRISVPEHAGKSIIYVLYIPVLLVGYLLLDDGFDLLTILVPMNYRS